MYLNSEEVDLRGLRELRSQIKSKNVVPVCDQIAFGFIFKRKIVLSPRHIELLKMHLRSELKDYPLLHITFERHKNYVEQNDEVIIQIYCQCSHDATDAENLLTTAISKVAKECTDAIPYPIDCPSDLIDKSNPEVRGCSFKFKFIRVVKN